MAIDKKIFKIGQGINITDEVMAIIAGLAATEVSGVASLEGNIHNKAIERAGIKQLSKGVKVDLDENNEVAIAISVNIEMGKEIQKLSLEVQDKVKSTVESMTGMKVLQVDVRIASVVTENESDI